MNPHTCEGNWHIGSTSMTSVDVESEPTELDPTAEPTVDVDELVRLLRQLENGVERAQGDAELLARDDHDGARGSAIAGRSRPRARVIGVLLHVLASRSSPIVALNFELAWSSLAVALRL